MPHISYSLCSGKSLEGVTHACDYLIAFVKIALVSRWRMDYGSRSRCTKRRLLDSIQEMLVAWTMAMAMERAKGGGLERTSVRD